LTKEENNERKRKVKRGKDEEVNGQEGGEEGCPGPTRGYGIIIIFCDCELVFSAAKDH